MINEQNSKKKDSNADTAIKPSSSESQEMKHAANSAPQTVKPQPYLQRIKQEFISWRLRRAEKWKDTPLHERETIRLTRVIAFSTVCYTLVSAWSLYEIHSSSIDTSNLAIQAKKQAEATHDVAIAAQKEMEITKDIQSARLIVTKFNCKDTIYGKSFTTQCKFAVFNDGPTAAEQISIGGGSEHHDNTVDGKDLNFSVGSQPDPVGRSLASRDTIQQIVDGVGGQVADYYKNQENIIYINFAVSYRDIFGRPHVTSECMKFRGWKGDKWEKCDFGHGRR